MDAVSSAEFECKLVSDDDSVGVIQDRIVNNVYNSDIVVCDVSHKNPNVMFELGMRLAFDKAVVIVKDDKTEYSFDTGIIEHVEYPRDLRFTKIEIFKRKLQDKVRSTYVSSLKEGYSPFLKNFGRFNIAKIENKDISANDYLIDAIEKLRGDVARMSSKINITADFDDELRGNDIIIASKETALRNMRSLVKVHLNDYMKKNNLPADGVSVVDLLNYLPKNLRNILSTEVLVGLVRDVIANSCGNN